MNRTHLILMGLTLLALLLAGCTPAQPAAAPAPTAAPAMEKVPATEPAKAPTAAPKAVQVEQTKGAQKAAAAKTYSKDVPDAPELRKGIDLPNAPKAPW